MKKALKLLLLTLNISIFSQNKSKKHKEIQRIIYNSPILEAIAKDVKASWPTSEKSIEASYQNIFNLSRRTEELCNKMKEAQCSLEIGIKVLDKVSNQLESPEVKQHPYLKKTQIAVKNAQSEHEKALKSVKAAKVCFEKNFDQFSKQIDNLNKALDSVNNKSKTAIEMSCPIFQLMRMSKKDKSSYPLMDNLERH